MPRRLLPRPWHEVGKRGQILLVFGLIWIGVGIGTLAAPTPVAWRNVPLLFDYPMGWAWVATGAFAVFYAVRPRCIAVDGLAFLALYAMPAYRAAAWLLGWVDYVIPGGGKGAPTGWLSSIIYLGLVAAVMICATWPEAPKTERTRGRS